MQAYIERLNEPGFVKKVKLPWTGIGHEILWPLAENYSYFHHARERIAPVFWDEWKKFLEAPGDEELFFQNDPFMVMLYNAFMFKPLMKQSKEDVLASNTLLSRLFLRALE